MLRECFGFPDFRQHQRSVVRAALQGRDVLVVLPTGAGKSICFQVPALVDPGLTIVVSPLISLMEDQVERAAPSGLPAASLSSVLGPGRRRRIEADVADGRIRLLYVSPERLGSARFAELIRRVNVSRLAVDEAHCISEWGHDFRPAYRRIASFRRAIGTPPLIALTATATPATRADIVANLALVDPIQVVDSVDRPNLHWAAVRVRSLADGVPEVGARVANGGGQALVYVQTRRSAERLAEALRCLGFAAASYHAGMSADSRDRAQRAFVDGSAHVVCATNAFGMGIDHAHVRTVCHLGVPGSLEALVQESGRAGRDGRPAYGTLISYPGDFALQRSFVRRDRPTSHQDRVRRRALTRLNAVRRYLSTRRCRRELIADYFGEPAPVCRGCDRCPQPPSSGTRSEAAKPYSSSTANSM